MKMCGFPLHVFKTRKICMESFTYNSKNAFVNFETDLTPYICQPQTDFPVHKSAQKQLLQTII